MIKWTPKVEDDLSLILEHIAENFSADLVISTINKLAITLETLLSKNPLAGSLLAENPFFSKVIVEGNSIYYCENPKDKHLYIVYIRPRNMDLEINRLKRLPALFSFQKR